VIRRFLFNCLPLALTAWIGCAPESTTQTTETADAYPSRAATIVCPWAAGGGTDRVSRILADLFKEQYNQPFVVQNRTGGSGAVGHSAGAMAAPDGYTISMITFELSTMHWMGITDLTYRNFEPVLQVNADAAAILVNKDSPFKTLADFLDHVRKNPGTTTLSGTATGGAWDLARAGFLLAAGLPVDSVRWIPSKGSAPSIVELLGGHVDAICCSAPEAAAQLESGELRALAVMSDERLAEFPDIPTCKEAGIDWSAVGWRGLALPKGTPPDIVKSLESKALEIVKSEAFKSFMKKNGFAIVIRDSAAFSAFLEAQEAQWKTVVEATGYSKL
jgi:tripartite-type tricarboxylate transporter receptor subunit TctC